jgi:hypothetical protein
LLLKQCPGVSDFLFVCQIRFLNQLRMKKSTLLLFSILWMSAYAEAQIRKGSFLLGGGIGFSVARSPGPLGTQEQRGLNISPSLGLAIKENLVLGLSGQYASSDTKIGNNPYTQYSNAYSAGMFVRKYMLLANRFYLFGEGGLNFRRVRDKSEYNGVVNSITNKSVNLTFYPGLAYAIHKNFHLEVGLNNLLTLGHSWYKEVQTLQTGTQVNKGSATYFSTNFSAASPLTVGFRIVLGGK